MSAGGAATIAATAQVAAARGLVVVVLPSDNAVRRLRSGTREEAHVEGAPGQALTP